MPRYAKVVVDPHAAWTERRIELRHFANVGEEAGLSRTVAVFAFESAAPGESAPRLAVRTFDGGSTVGMTKRGLELEAWHDADGA